MTYTKTQWVDNTTPLSAANLNNLETQYDDAIATGDTRYARVDGGEEYLRTDANAPNPQTVANGIELFNNLFVSSAQSGSASDSQPLILRGWTGTTETQVFFKAASGGGWYVANNANDKVIFLMSDNGDINGFGNMTVAGSINGLYQEKVNLYQATTSNASNAWTVTFSGLPANATQFILGIQLDGNSYGLFIGQGSSVVSYTENTNTYSAGVASFSNGTLTITGSTFSANSSINCQIYGLVY